MLFFPVINLGLRSVRIIVFDETAQKLWHGWYPVKTTMTNDWVEQDPNIWWNLTKKLIREALEAVPKLKTSQLYFSVTSSACCLVPLGEHGNVLRNAIMVSDKRAVVEAAELREKYSEEFEICENFLPVASYMMPKVIWMKRHEQDIHKRVWKYLSPNDYLIYKLTGEAVTDELNAQKFYYSSEATTFFARILSDYQLNPQVFPKVGNLGSVVGSVRGELQRELGLPPTSSVVLTTYDAICAFWGAGVSQIGDCCNVIGTVSSCRVLSDRIYRSKSNLLTQKFSLFDSYIVGGSNNLDGGLVEWAKDSFYGDSYPTKHVYSIMEEEASRSVVGARGLVFIPYILGERAPFWDREVRGLFLGIEKYHTREDFMRSIYESSAFMLRDMCTEIERAGLQISNIRLSGGLAQSDLVCNLRAQVTGKPVYVLTEKESTALGSCIISLFALGLIRGVTDIYDLVRIEKRYTPQVRVHKEYSKLFDLFKKVYEGSRSINLLRRQVYRDLYANGVVYTLNNM